MRFNELGEAAGGVGDGICSVKLNTGHVVIVGHRGPDGKLIVNEHGILQRGGGTSWVNNDVVIYQTYDYNDGHAILEQCNVRTLKKTRVSDRGANRIVAGGGRWAAWLAGAGRVGDTAFGVYGDFRSLLGNIADASRDGTFAIVSNYQNDSGMALYAADGRITVLPEHVNARDIHVSGPTSAIWVNEKTGLFDTINQRVPLQACPGLGPKIVRMGDEDWIVYWAVDLGGIITHPVDSLKGYIIVQSDRAYWHDAVPLNDRIRVGFSTGQAELPEEFVYVDQLLTAPRFDFGVGRMADGSISIPVGREFTTTTTGGKAGTIAETTLVTPQLNLLEDDIVYRLALLAVNVLQPLKDQYPNIVIKSGFRQVNSGISQHELGEAVDIQINNQTPELLYEVANWMQNHLAFDQLVLNFTNVGDKQPWIHVSFSPKSLRQQVLTKDFADTFHEGLFFVEPLTGEDQAAAVREQQALDAQIFAEMEKTAKRSAKLQPVSSVMDDVYSVISGTEARDASGLVGPGSGGTGTGGANQSQRAKLVACVQKALGLRGTPYNSQENADIAFETVKRVAWLLRDEGCGLLIGPQGGENITFWNGYYFRSGRVMFSDGQVYKVLTAVEDGPLQGGHVPTWDDNGISESSLYVPAMDPGAEINLNWMQCEVPSSTPANNETFGVGSGPDNERPDRPDPSR